MRSTGDGNGAREGSSKCSIVVLEMRLIRYGVTVEKKICACILPGFLLAKPEAYQGDHTRIGIWDKVTNEREKIRSGLSV